MAHGLDDTRTGWLLKFLFRHTRDVEFAMMPQKTDMIRVRLFGPAIRTSFLNEIVLLPQAASQKHY